LTLAALIVPELMQSGSADSSTGENCPWIASRGLSIDFTFWVAAASRIRFQFSPSLSLTVWGVMVATSLAMFPIRKLYWNWSAPRSAMLFGALARSERNRRSFQARSPRRYCGAVGRHREIGLSSSVHHWIVQVSLELQLLSGAMNLARWSRFRRFAFLRHISQPAHYNNSLGDTVQISAEIMPVRLR
jgi:hypothetical protein